MVKVFLVAFFVMPEELEENDKLLVLFSILIVEDFVVVDEAILVEVVVAIEQKVKKVFLLLEEEGTNLFSFLSSLLD